MSKVLDEMSVAELDALIEKARQVREDTRERRRKELKAEVESKLKSEGFQVTEVLGPRPRPEPMPAKYSDGNGQTWSGKGRMPGWLQERIEKGGSLERFLIGKSRA